MSERGSGRAGFVLATVASAVGLGSIWKFPYEVGQNGGAVFVLCYESRPRTARIAAGWPPAWSARRAACWSSASIR